MPSTYLGQIGSVASLDRARIALLVDAEHFRRCAARGHERLTGSRTSPSRVNIDGAGFSQWVERAASELGLEGSGAMTRGRSSRRIYDVLSEGRRQRWRQRRYHGVLEAEGFVVKTARARAGNRMQLPPGLAADLVHLTQSGPIDTALLLAGDRGYAAAVADARERGAEVILLVPPASSALVAESLRAAATRAIALHPEVFETLYHVRDRSRPGAERACAG